MPQNKKPTKKPTASTKTKKSTPARKSDAKWSLKNVLFPEGRAAFFKGDTLRFIVGLIVLLIALFMLLAFTSNIFTGDVEQSAIESDLDFTAENYGGRLGALTSYYFMTEHFGFSAFFIPVFLIALSVKLMRVYKVRLWKLFLHCGFLLIWTSVAFSLLLTSWGDEAGLSFNPGGLHGKNICALSEQYVGLVPTYAIVIATALLYFIYLSSETINLLRRAMRPHDYIKEKWNECHHKEGDEEDSEDEELEEDEPEKKEFEESYTVQLDFDKDTENEQDPQLVLDQPEEPTTELQIDETKEEEAADPSAPQKVDPSTLPPYDPRLDLEYYKFPTIDLLKHYDDQNNSVDMKEQNDNKNRIVTILHNFGVEITGIKATIGPTITLYEITPAPGVKISKIRNLEDDIALSLSALGIRIIAPIPGKGTIGIEVPNKNPHIVSMESIINTRKFQESTFELPIALGKTITNEVFMVDLAKMPHLLVAGATGQGKSVGLNAIITSLLYKKHPSELKIVMVDPKKVEFSVYTPIEKHFLAMIPGEEDPIITDVTKVVQTLKSLCQLMDHRYDLLKKAKVRNIKEYNAKFRARQLNPQNGHEFMPYIVVIIDEFGDLIMTAGKEVELPIARIAQLARAVGMHMVIATQRPTTNIITGTIKANFPARMAFKVSSRVDSQTILDRTGANQLIGRGDMLFLAGNDPVRVQCAFVDTPEVERINDFIASQQGYLSAFELPEVLAEGDGDAGGKSGIEAETLDPMFAEAAHLIVVHQSGSTSLIQRKFSIGYNRAGRLMDQLERAGIVGPTKGAKPRDVLCSDEIELDAKISAIQAAGGKV